MKKHHSDDPPSALQGLLREWQVDASLPPDFQGRVWRCIERAETAPAASGSLAEMWAKWIAHALAKPTLAAAYVLLLLFIGAGLGWTQARDETARVTSELSARYARTVDPYQPPPRP